ncbi:hypothetical protein PF008_g33211, partial [Phytophthora fragariae]
MHRRPVLTSRPRPQVRLAFLNGLAAMSPSSTTPSPRILPPPRLRAPPPPRPCTAPPPSPWTCRSGFFSEAKSFGGATTTSASNSVDTSSLDADPGVRVATAATVKSVSSSATATSVSSSATSACSTGDTSSPEAEPGLHLAIAAAAKFVSSSATKSTLSSSGFVIAAKSANNTTSQAAATVGNLTAESRK